MKTSVIVIYIPPRSTQEEKDFLDKNLVKLKKSKLHKGYDIMYIEDPARIKAESIIWWMMIF